ncbi:MAG: hypothetical protein AAF471_09110 [Myxococcota bacterium]
MLVPEGKGFFIPPGLFLGKIGKTGVAQALEEQEEQAHPNAQASCAQLALGAGPRTPYCASLLAIHCV